jgi:hypothetical protein
MFMHAHAFYVYLRTACIGNLGCELDEGPHHLVSADLSNMQRPLRTLRGSGTLEISKGELMARQ